MDKCKVIEEIHYCTWNKLIHKNNWWKKQTSSFIWSISCDTKVHYVCGIRIALSVYWQIITRKSSSINNSREITYVINKNILDGFSRSRINSIGKSKWIAICVINSKWRAKIILQSRIAWCIVNHWWVYGCGCHLQVRWIRTPSLVFSWFCWFKWDFII